MNDKITIANAAIADAYAKMLAKKQLNESATDDETERFMKWKSDVAKAHPDKKLVFKGRIEKHPSGELHTISAEEPGHDRSYGVWDHSDNSAHIFETTDSGGDGSAYNKYLLAKLGDLPRTLKGYEHGTMAESEDHPDEEQDKELIRDMVKKDALKPSALEEDGMSKPSQYEVDDKAAGKAVVHNNTVPGHHGDISGLNEDGQGLAEASPFSYGSKKPRKGSVAANAEQKRREQDKGKLPIEPRDQMVGVAKVKRDAAEGSETECPSCHTTDIKTYSDGEKECHHCHKTWDVQSMAEGTGVTDYNPKSQGGTRKELLAKYHKTKDPKDAEAARKAGATQKELQGLNEAEQGVGDFGGGGYPKTPNYKVGDNVSVKGYQGIGQIAYIKHRGDVGVKFTERSHPRVVTTIDDLIPRQGLNEASVGGIGMAGGGSTGGSISQGGGMGQGMQGNMQAADGGIHSTMAPTPGVQESEEHEPGKNVGEVNGKMFSLPKNGPDNIEHIKEHNPHLSNGEARAVQAHVGMHGFCAGVLTEHGGHSVVTTCPIEYFVMDRDLDKDALQESKWIHTDPEKRGMFDGWNIEDLNKEIKNQKEKHAKSNQPVSEKDKTYMHELEFALRAKHGHGFSESAENLSELDTKTLASYKEKAAKEASQLDKEAFAGGEGSKEKIQKANKRFSGVVKATNKQFANDKKLNEDASRKLTPELAKDILAKFELKGAHALCKALTWGDEAASELIDMMVDSLTKLASEGSTEKLEETLTASTPIEKWIKDFVESDNPKFDGKSKEERRKMAIGAYYGAQKK